MTAILRNMRRRPTTAYELHNYILPAYLAEQMSRYLMPSPSRYAVLSTGAGLVVVSYFERASDVRCWARLVHAPVEIDHCVIDSAEPGAWTVERRTRARVFVEDLGARTIFEHYEIRTARP